MSVMHWLSCVAAPAQECRCGVGDYVRFHFLLDPLNRFSPGPKNLGDLQDANALPLRTALQGNVDLGPSEPHALSNSARFSPVRSPDTGPTQDINVGAPALRPIQA
jgi:hypothetical protein